MVIFRQYVCTCLRWGVRFPIPQYKKYIFFSSFNPTTCLIPLSQRFTVFFFFSVIMTKKKKTHKYKSIVKWRFQMMPVSQKAWSFPLSYHVRFILFMDLRYVEPTYHYISTSYWSFPPDKSSNSRTLDWLFYSRIFTMQRDEPTTSGLLLADKRTSGTQKKLVALNFKGHNTLFWKGTPFSCLIEKWHF